MRTLYITSLALIMSCGLSAQIVFESNMDDWDGTMLNDWFGSKTSLEDDSVEMVTAGATYGTAVAQLTNLESGHKRFTTQAIALEAGETYEVEVWVKGSGEVRTNVYDGSSDNFGYNDYNVYVPVTTELSSFVQTILPDTTSSEQQVIVSFRNGVIEVDRVEVRVGMAVEPTAATIYEIQYTDVADGNSPLAGEVVITSGVVTGVASFGYYIQAGTGTFTGLFVEDDSNSPAVGDELNVAGTVEENFMFTQLTNVTVHEVLSSGNSVPPIVLGTNAVNNEQYEGMLVQTEGFSVEEVNGFGEWPIDDLSGPILVDDQMFPFTPVIGTYYSVTGPLNYSFSAFKIEPRDEDDVAVVSSVTEESTIDFEVYPNPASTFFQISLSNSSGATIDILDMAGRSVDRVAMNGSSTTIDVSELESGNYILRVTTTEGIGLHQLTVD